MDFESLFREHSAPLMRYVLFRMADRADAEDVLQNVWMTAYERFSQLRSEDSFKPWILAIARNQCADAFRKKARTHEIPLDAIEESCMSRGRFGMMYATKTSDVMDKLSDMDQRMLYLAYWKNLPQYDIAAVLGIPLGTVKSRLHAAREHFRALYPSTEKEKENDIMTKLPERMPAYTIAPVNEPSFDIRAEELMGWPIVPRVGEKRSWGLYDAPSGIRTEYTEMEVVGRAEVHGIEGVEIIAVQHDSEDYYRTGSEKLIERRFIAQLTETHVRYLAESHFENGVRKCSTFLDGEGFLNNWGFGEDNCGALVQQSARGVITRDGTEIKVSQEAYRSQQDVLDIVGRYQVTIGGKTFDTVCLIDVMCFDDTIVSEQYLDSSGRTILWRRFNRDDWAIERFGGKPWSEQLPANERITVNGQTYVHWYDCITDYIL